MLGLLVLESKSIRQKGVRFTVTGGTVKMKLSRKGVLPIAMSTTTETERAEPYHELLAEDDFQLMEWLNSFVTDDPQTAQSAWAVLFIRHKEFLEAVVKRTVQDCFGDAAAVDDIVAETFKKVYEKAGTFEQPEESLDVDSKRRCFRAWLSRIAVNLIRDAQRGQQRFTATNIEKEHWDDIEVSLEDLPAWDVQRLGQVMDEVLDAREQDILRTTYRFYDPDTGKPPRLPSDEVQRICTEHNITAEHLRQIRGRALKKLTEAMEGSCKDG